MQCKTQKKTTAPRGKCNKHHNYNKDKTWEIPTDPKMVSFVLLFTDGALGLWYIKASTMSAHSSQLSSQQIFRSGKEKWKPQYASALLWHRHQGGLSLSKCLYCRSFFYDNKSFWVSAVNVAVTTLTCSPLWNNAIPLRQKKAARVLMSPQLLIRKNDPDFQKWFSLCNSIRECILCNTLPCNTKSDFCLAAHHSLRKWV